MVDGTMENVNIIKLSYPIEFSMVLSMEQPMGLREKTLNNIIISSESKISERLKIRNYFNY